ARRRAGGPGPRQAGAWACRRPRTRSRRAARAARRRAARAPRARPRAARWWRPTAGSLPRRARRPCTRCSRSRRTAPSRTGRADTRRSRAAPSGPTCRPVTTGRTRRPTRAASRRAGPARPRAAPGSLLRLVLGVLAARGVGGERGDEGGLRDLDGPDVLHALLTLLLLLEQLALAADVAAVALGEDVLAHRAHGLARDDARADGRLDRHLELLARDDLLELGGHHHAVVVRLVLVHDRAEGVDLLALEQDVHLDEVGHLVARRLVVERRVPARAGLELVEEVEHDLGERQREAQLDAVLREVVHAEHLPAAVVAQAHDGADELARREDRRAHDGLADLLDLAARELRRVGHLDDRAVLERDVVDDVRRRRDEVEVELALEPLADDLQVQQAEEPDAEAEAERDRRLGLVVERGVVELELVERVAQHRVVRAVDRVQAREDHGLRVGVAAERLVRGLGRVRHRVADLGLAHVLHARDEVADLAHAEALGDDRLGRDDADLEELVRRARRHHDDALARVEVAVDDAHVRDDAAVRVVHRVEDHGARRGVGVADGGGHALGDAVEQRL